MHDDRTSAKKGRWVQVSQIIPPWIQAVAAVGGFLVAAGAFAAGHATAGGVPAPRNTVTVTVTATPGGSGGSASPGHARSGSSPGVKLASYPVSLPPFYTVPLSRTQPTQSQFVRGAAVTSGDLYLDTNGLVGPGTDFKPENGDKMVVLPSGSTPTYRSCSTGTGFVTSVNNTVGAAFCLIESTGKVAGISVQSINSAQPYDSVLRVTIWQGSL